MENICVGNFIYSSAERITSWASAWGLPSVNLFHRQNVAICNIFWSLTLHIKVDLQASQAFQLSVIQLSYWLAMHIEDVVSLYTADHFVARFSKNANNGDNNSRLDYKRLLQSFHLNNRRMLSSFLHISLDKNIICVICAKIKTPFAHYYIFLSILWNGLWDAKNGTHGKIHNIYQIDFAIFPLE